MSVDAWDEWTPEEVVAALCLRQAGRTLGRTYRRLQRIFERLPPAPRDRDPEDWREGEEHDLITRLRSTAGCVLDNLRPAREALRELEGELQRTGTLRLRGERRPGSPHAVFRELLAGLHPPDLAGWRHLVTCPLCLELTRRVLVEMPGGESPEAAGEGAENPLPLATRRNRRRKGP